MSLSGTWKRINVENGEAFGKAIGATEEQLKVRQVFEAPYFFIDCIF